jgi:hypothetical protein
MLTNPPTLL